MLDTQSGGSPRRHVLAATSVGSPVLWVGAAFESKCSWPRGTERSRQLRRETVCPRADSKYKAKTRPR